MLVEQLFVNLFENVARHTPEATKVTVTGSVDGQNLEIRVMDNGPGFEKTEQEKIFEKLYRAKGSSGAGFGLGLSICRAIMNAHRGTITASSSKDGGAEFIVRFPLIENMPEVPNE